MVAFVPLLRNRDWRYFCYGDAMITEFAIAMKMNINTTFSGLHLGSENHSFTASAYPNDSDHIYNNCHIAKAIPRYVEYHQGSRVHWESDPPIIYFG